MDAATSRTPRLRFVLLAALAILVAACSDPIGRSTVPPDATGSIVPAQTATPAPDPTATETPPFPVTLTDDDGTSVVVEAEPQRIVSLTPAATETLFAVGAGDRVVAKVEDITPFPPEADGLPVVATYQAVDVERIVELAADLVIAGGANFNQQDAVDQLRRVGIPVLVLYPEGIDGALAGIELIGDATGTGDAARDLTASMRAGFDQVAAAAEDLPKPRVFYEIDASTGPIYTPAEGSAYGAMLELAGSEPILGDATFQISLESLVAADPEIILLGNPLATPDEVRQRPGWGGMTAVETGAIYKVNDTIVTRPGPRLVDGLRELARAIHPDVDLPEPSASAAAVR